MQGKDWSVGTRWQGEASGEAIVLRRAGDDGSARCVALSRGSPRPEQTRGKLTALPLPSSSSRPKHLAMLHLARPTLESAGVQRAERRGTGGTFLPGLGRAGRAAVDGGQG